MVSAAGYTASTHGQQTWVPCHRIHNLTGRICESTQCRGITARRRQQDADGVKNTNIQVKVWQSFDSPSTAPCNAPFNAPCSPVTPLLLVISWYCAVLPCAPSRSQPQSLHTAQQAIVVYAETSVRGQRCDSEVQWIQSAILACPRDLPLLPVFGLQQLEMKIAHPGS